MRATEHTSRALLLTGLPGVGKSTVVRHVAGAVHGLRVEGFITDEIRVHGRRVGFQLAPLRGNTRVLAHVDIESPHRVGRYGVDVRVVDEVVGKMMHRDDTADLYLIDEIGKMECFSRRFVSALEELLDRGRLGQGAWAAAKYGYGSPGTGWRRLHLAVDEGGRFVAAELTDNDMTDASVFPTLLGRSDGKIVRLTADGAYDRREVHDAAGGRGAYVVIPPRRSAVISRDPVPQNEKPAHQAHGSGWPSAMVTRERSTPPSSSRKQFLSLQTNLRTGPSGSRLNGSAS